MKRRYADGGIYTAEMGQPPMDPEMAPPSPKPKAVKKPPVAAEPMPGEEIGVRQEKKQAYKKKFASGGYTKAADGIAKKGKTRGTMVMCKGGKM
jgi:hypothetical protein